MGKKKRPGSAAPQLETSVPESDNASNLSVEKDGTINSADQESVENIPIFKNPKFVHSGKGGAAAGKKNRVWKTLKQLIVAERSIPNAITYFNLDSPPSIKPSKKYSDISGLKANYTDPITKLRFANSSEFQTIRTLAPEIVNAYLTLRKAATP